MSRTPALTRCFQIGWEFLLNSFLICLCDLVFLLERYETYSLESFGKVLHCFHIFSLITSELILRYFRNYMLLGLKISIKIILWLCIFVPFCKKLIAGSAESFPKLFRFLAGNCSDFLPLLLEIDEAVSGLFPICAALESFSLYAESYLLLKIGIHIVLILAVEIPLAAVKIITCGTETVIDLLILFLRGKTYCLPLLLDVLNLFGEGIPLIGLGDLTRCNLFNFFAQESLLCKVFSLLNLLVLEMSLILLVYHCRSCLETFPNLLTELLGDRTIFLPLLMKLLKLPEGLNYIWIFCKCLCFLAESLLHFQILFKIKVTQFAVNLDHIIELLYIELICFIDISEILRRYRSDSPPSVLDLTECREGSIHILLLFKQRLKIFNYSLLLCKVLFPFLLYLPVIFGTLFPILIIQGLESPFYFCKRILRNAFLSC